jgi:hypothetical protein
VRQRVTECRHVTKYKPPKTFTYKILIMTVNLYLDIFYSDKFKCYVLKKIIMLYLPCIVDFVSRHFFWSNTCLTSTRSFKVPVVQTMKKHLSQVIHCLPLLKTIEYSLNIFYSQDIFIRNVLYIMSFYLT